MGPKNFIFEYLFEKFSTCCSYHKKKLRILKRFKENFMKALFCLSLKKKLKLKNIKELQRSRSAYIKPFSNRMKAIQYIVFRFKFCLKNSIVKTFYSIMSL